MIKRTCTIDGCTKPHRAKGYCGSHYNQHHPSPNRRAKKLVDCAWCGKQILKSAGGGRKYGQVCSNECRSNLTPKRTPSKCDLPPDHPVMWIGKSSQWPRYGWKECVHCGAEYAASTANSKYCSKTCSWQWHERNNGVRPLAEIAAEVRQCQRCDGDYQSPYTQRVYCSDLCRELEREDRGVELYHGWISQSQRVMLYQRDNYTCWLCNKACDTTVDPRTHDDAPTLDHVIPRSKGGTHAHNNLRTACRRCNSIRSDSGAMSIDDLLQPCG